MKKKIDSYFRDGLNTPHEPPIGSWENIEFYLNQDNKKRGLVLWKKILGSLALLLLLGGGGYFINENYFSNNESSAITNLQENNGNSINTNSSNSPISQKNIKGNLSQINNPVDQGTIVNSERNELNVESNKVNNNSNHNNSYLPEIPNKTLAKNRMTDNPVLSISNHANNSESSISEQSIDYINYNYPKVKNLNTEDLFALNLPEFDQFSLYLPATVNPVSLKEKKSQKIKSKKKTEFDKFYISGFVSPTAFNTFVGNSMLADDFSEFKTNNKVTLSYGVKGAYAINKNVKIRTGITKMGLEQITQNVPLATDISANPGLTARDEKNNINYNGHLRVNNNPEQYDGEILNRGTIGDMTQISEYLEIPLEAEVALLKTNSIGISVTGGGSTWLLTKNQLIVNTGEQIEELGEANNLRRTSFSANAGVKFDMELTDKVQLNLEPNFKYRINPVTNIERYQPYSVGVNAGITVSLE